MPTQGVNFLGAIGSGGVMGAFDGIQRLIDEARARAEHAEKLKEGEFRRGLDTRAQSERERAALAGEGFEGERVGLDKRRVVQLEAAGGRDAQSHTADMDERGRKLKVITDLVARNPGALGDSISAKSAGLNLDDDAFRSPTERGTRAGQEAAGAWTGGGQSVAQGKTDIDLGADKSRISAQGANTLQTIAAQGGQTRQNIAASGDQDRRTMAARPPAGASSQVADPAKAQEMAAEALALALRLKTMPGKSGAVGAPSMFTPGSLGRLIPGRGGESFEGSESAGYEEELKRLRALLTTDNLGLLKGVLSDSDMRMLTAAATSLSQRKGEKSFDVELDRVIESLRGKGGVAPMSSRGGLTPEQQAEIDAFVASQKKPIKR